MDSTYAGAYGHIKALSLDLLSKEQINRIKESSKDEFIAILSGTNYKQDIDEVYNRYREEDLIDIVVNTHFLRNCKNAIGLLPSSGKGLIRAYLSRIDIENIKLILAAKLIGKDLQMTENMLTINRGFPLGMQSPMLSKDEYSNIIQQKDLAEVINYLTRYDYGKVLLPFSVSAELGRDVSGMATALDIEYYNGLLKAFKFYNGNEGPILRFIQSQIDVRNIMTVIKAIEMNKTVENILIKGGSISTEKLAEMSKMRIEDAIKDIPFDLSEALELYRKEGLVANFEVELKRQSHDRYLQIFKASSISLESVLSFIIEAELERDTIRLSWFKKYYNIEKEVVNIGYGI